MITNQGLLALTALLSGGTPSVTIGTVAYSASNITGLYAGSIEVGRTASPAAASRTDTALSDPSPRVVTNLRPTYPAAGVVNFNATIPPGTDVGVTYYEVGLFSACGLLLARSVVYQPKPSAIGLNIGVSITIPRAPPIVVTDDGANALTALLAGGLGFPVIGGVAYDPTTISNLHAGSIRLGAASSPSAASTADTALDDPNPYTVPTFTATYSGTATTTYTGTVPSNALSGVTVTEIGLFLASGAMFSRSVVDYTFPTSEAIIASHPCVFNLV